MCVGSGWVHDRSPSKNSIMGCGNGRLFGKYSTFRVTLTNLWWCVNVT